MNITNFLSPEEESTINVTNRSHLSLGYDCIIRAKYTTPTLGYSYYVCGPVMAIFIILGLIGNVICLKIFATTRPVPLVNFYSIPLSISDCAVLISSFFMSNLPHLLYGHIQSYGPYVTIYPHATFFGNFAYTFCVWVTVILSLERYFALCHPLKHKIYDAKRRSMVVTLSCFVAALLYNIPRYWETEIFQCYDLTRRQLIDFLQDTDVHASQYYWIVYKAILSSLLFSFGPLIVLCFLNVKMIRQVKTIRMQLINREETMEITDREECSKPVEPGCWSLSLHSNSNSSFIPYAKRQISVYKEQRRVLAYTLFTVATKFFICHSLPAIIDICESFMDSEQFSHSIMDDLLDTSTFLVVINSSTNFIIHMLCNRSFRRTVIKFLRFHRRGPVVV